jgi:hypothetical protein
VRFLCAVGEYFSAFLAVNHSAWISFPLLAGFLQDNSLPVLLGMGWPLIIGLILRRSTNRIYVGAAALTFFILALGGFLQLAEGLSLKWDPTLVVGSFTISRSSLRHFVPADWMRGSLGVVQLTLELGTAVAASGLITWFRPQPAGEFAAPRQARRRLRGRLAIYLSLAFLVVGMRLPLWTAYIEVLNRSSTVRNFVLSTEPRARHPYMDRISIRPRQGMEAELALSSAARLASTNRVLEAKEAYLQVIAQAEAMAESSGGAGEVKFELARALNNLAWLLVTCEDKSQWKPVEAVGYAQRAVKIAPDEGTYWNTLGTAYARARNWEEARKALFRSMELRGGQGDAFDWFFLAMICARKDEPEQAREWYDKAVAWVHDGHEADLELYRFQVEAAELLKLPKPPAPVVKKHEPPVFEDKAKVVRRRMRAPENVRYD